MAIYMLSAKIISRSAGGNAVAAAAYRTGEKLHDGEKTHDYTGKGNVVSSFIIAPDGAPAWAYQREELWQKVELCERRKDSQLARELVVSLPRELTLRASTELVREFVTRELVSRGMIADISIHNPLASDGKNNPHAHIMLTMRDLDADGGFFGKKRRDWNAEFGNTKGQGSQGGVTDAQGLSALRERWADALNAKLANAGVLDRVTHLSNEAAGIDRTPQPKLGKHWYRNTRYAKDVHAQREAVRRENARSAHLRPSVTTSNDHSLARTVAQNYAIDAELKNGLYGGPPVEPSFEWWQHGHGRIEPPDKGLDDVELER